MGKMPPPKAINRNSGAGPGVVRGAKVQKQKKKHKVVLESAGNKDEDKLQVVLSFHAEPPPGHTFIPAGNTQLTAALKTYAKRGGDQIMAVSATPHAQRHELSREVHRIGYHFPTHVVDQVCSHYGIRLDSSGRIIGEQDSEKLFMKISQKGEVVLNETIRDQVTINTEAKEIIRDLFPKIPDNDLFQIIKTAFQLGTNRVGTAEEIPLVRRAQLSVVAHIRHTYTSYDRLLRQMPYNEARHSVEKTTLRKLVEWRGDENDRSEESRKKIDDAVREIVVLSDEEETESELEEGQVREGDEPEPVAKPARPEVITEHRPVSPGHLSSEEEAPKGYRYVPPVPRKNLLAQQEPENVSRQQESRYARWDQVRHEYQSGVPSQETVLARIPLAEPRHVPVTRDVVYEPLPVRYVLDDPQPARIIRQPSPPTLFRSSDGRVYERVPLRNEDTTVRRVCTPPSGRAPPTTTRSRRSASPRAERPQNGHRTPSMNNDGTILQSIEPPDSAYKTALIKPNQFPIRFQQPETRAAEHQSNLIDLTSSAERATERMRLDPSSPPRSFERPDRDVIMIDENPPPRQRHLIELGYHAPAPVPSWGQQVVRRHPDDHGSFPRPYHEPLPPRRDYHQDIQYVREPHRTPVEYMPGQRQILYEAVDDRISKVSRYESLRADYHHQHQDERQYYAPDNRVHSRLPQEEYVSHSNTMPTRYIVLDAAVPINPVQRSTNTR